MKRTILVCLLLSIVTAIPYAQIARHDFVNCDDQEYITENPHIESGLTRQNIRWAFTTFYAGNWHPVTWLSHLLDVELFGLSPMGHHLHNLVLHIANGVLLFLLLYGMSGAIWRSAFVSALFCIHPLHVESVAWVSERKDLLSTFFGLLTLHAYHRYVRHPAAPSYFAILLGFVASLMAKPMLVTLPFLMLLLDYWPLGRMGWGAPSPQPMSPTGIPLGRLIGEKVPFFVLSVACCIVTLVAQRGAMSTLTQVTLVHRMCNAAASYVRYIFKLVWPVDLAVLYPLQPCDPLFSILSLVFIGTVTALALRYIRAKPFFAVGWLWYLGTLIPVIGIVQVGSQAMADRYTYLPTIGLFVAVTWLCREAVPKSPPVQKSVLAVSLLILTVLAFLTRGQATYWKDHLTLMAHAAEVTENNQIAHAMLGSCYIKSGEYDRAMKHLAFALRLRPDDSDGHYNMGLALALLERTKEAEPHLREAVRLNPRNSKAAHNLGVVFNRLGRPTEAVLQFERALELAPGDPEVMFELAFSLTNLGRFEEGIHYYEILLNGKPDDSNACNNLGVALVRSGELAEAVKRFRDCVALNPGNPELTRNLEAALRSLGQKGGSAKPIQ